MSLQGQETDRPQSVQQSAAAPLGGGSAGGIMASNPRIQQLVDAGPKRSTVLLVILGMVIGMVAAYVVIPTEFTGASPRHMSRQAIEQWVRMVAVGHSADVRYDDSNALLVLQQIPNPQLVVEGLAANTSIPAAERTALEALTEIDGFATLVGPLAPQDPGCLRQRFAGRPGIGCGRACDSNSHNRRADDHPEPEPERRAASAGAGRQFTSLPGQSSRACAISSAERGPAQHILERGGDGKERYAASAIWRTGAAHRLNLHQGTELR